MKERLVTLALAIAALLLFYALFIPKPNADAQAPDLPLSTETRDHGYQGAWRWLMHEAIPVQSLRTPYTRLAALAPHSPRGNLLITTLPHRLPARADELNDLDEWVSRGNTLLVLAALDDTPAWALRADDSLLKTLSRMTRLSFHTVEAPANGSSSSDVASQTKRAVRMARQALQAPPVRLQPVGSHPLLEGIDLLWASSEFPASQWSADAMDGAGFLAIADLVPAAADRLRSPAAWLKRQGEGQIIVLACASLLDNQQIGATGNAKLLSNIIAWSRSAEGLVIFDDDHQGLVDYYDAKAFFRDPRLHRTIGWIIALWFLFVLGWQRLRPTQDEWNPTDVTAFIGVTGDFLAASTAPASIADRLFHNFFNAVRRQFSLPEDGMPTWDLLADHLVADRASRRQLETLQGIYQRLHADQRVDLTRLHNLLSYTLAACRLGGFD